MSKTASVNGKKFFNNAKRNMTESLYRHVLVFLGILLIPVVTLYAETTNGTNQGTALTIFYSGNVAGEIDVCG